MIDIINIVTPTVNNEYYKKVFKDIMYRKCQIKLQILIRAKKLIAIKAF